MYHLVGRVAWISTSRCLLQLGHAEQAATLLDDGIALYDESFTRNRQAYLTHLADALSRPGKQRDLDAAADCGAEAIRIAESLHSTYSIDRLVDLYRRMKPHAKVPAVGDFLERARGFVSV
ncbi:MAG: hypothetical protein ACRDRS_25645 [Pseudonocardiaceae bacterium]